MKMLLGAAVFAMSSVANAVVLNFDSFAGSTQIQSIGEFAFSNLYALDTTGFYPSGYVNGVVSPRNVAYNGDGRAAAITSPTAFSLTSAYLAGAWNDGLTVQVVGTLAGATVFTQSFTVGTQAARFTVFDHALIDKAVFATTGGTHHVGYNDGVGTQFVLDNLAINERSGIAATVPEPASWALMFGGFGIVGAALRRRTRAAAV